MRARVFDGRKNILIVEDNNIQREGLATVLRQQGFSVVPVADGREALQILKGSAPDLVLLDMLIPDDSADGWWFSPNAGKIPALPPFLFLSSRLYRSPARSGRLRSVPPA